MTEVLLFKQLFVYLIPLNILVGEYNLGFQYRLNEEWAADMTIGYQDAIEGSYVANVYQDLLRQGAFYYSGPVVKFSVVSLVPRGLNPLKTDYNQLELGIRFLSYDSLDFNAEAPPDLTFNISEKMQAVNLSWKAGYNLVPRAVFEVNTFVGFGLQMRFIEKTVNSQGYNYNSHEYDVNEVTNSLQFAPLFHAGIKVGIKNRYPKDYP